MGRRIGRRLHSALIIGRNLPDKFGAQFTRLRDGGHFWYENILNGDLVEEIESTTLAGVIARNTNLDSLQDNVFFIA